MRWRSKGLFGLALILEFTWAGCPATNAADSAHASTKASFHDYVQYLRMLSPEGYQVGLGIKAIAANGNHSLALASDGTVWEWGGKWSAPTRVSGLSEIVSVAAGFDYGLAVKNDRTLWAWGANEVGQLGDGTTTSRPTPVQVAGLTDVVGVAARLIREYDVEPTAYNVAVRGDGTVWEWGGPFWECCEWRQRLMPSQVPGLSGVVSVAARPYGGIALKADWTVWRWGTDYPQGPAQVRGLFGMVAITGSLLLKNDGTVWWWYGERVSGIDGVTAISDGGHHYLALKRDGTVWSWGLPLGSNRFGQLGDGTTENRATPAQVKGLTNMMSVAAGGFHSLALKSDGTLWAWGLDGQGQLGIGSPVWRSVPGEVNGLNEVAAIEGNEDGNALSTWSSSYALKRDGTIWAWGKSPDSDKAWSMPERGVSGLSNGVAIAGHVVLQDDGTVWTWRPAWWPYWALWPPPPAEQPVRVSELEGIIAITKWFALKNDGSVWRIGSPPWRVQGLERIVGIALGTYSGINLAVGEDGTVWQWSGWNERAQAGEKVSGLNNVVGAATGGYFRGCPWGMPGISACPGKDVYTEYRQALAVKADGTVWVWEEREDFLDGRRVDPPIIRRTPPTEVRGITGVTRVVAAGRYSLALKTDGTVWAWGDNDSGQLGDGTTTPRTTPVQVAGLNGVVAIAASGTHSLALRADGTVWSWGLNDSGQLGDGRAMMQTFPVQVIQPGSPDLSIEMSHDGNFSAGTQGVYTLTITNTGLTATFGVVTVTDALPPGLRYDSSAGNNWTCSATDRIVTCTNPGPIEPGIRSVIALTVDVGASAWPGATNLASVSNESDRNIANNAVGDPTIVLPKPR